MGNRLDAIRTDIENLDKTAEIIFDLAYSEFQDNDKGEVNSYLKTLADIGARTIAIKAQCQSILTILEIAKDIKNGITV